MIDIFKCEKCGKIFDEFEMNYRDAQVDKKCLCQKCRAKIIPARIIKYCKECENTYQGEIDFCLVKYKLCNPDTIPSWCPLEDAPEATLQEEIK